MFKTESQSIVDLSDSDTRFLRTLERELLAAGLSKCHQCGVCTATCPVREIEERFNPRRIMKLAKLGLKELVLYYGPSISDAFPWAGVGLVSGMLAVLIGLVIIVFLIFEPRGLAHRWELLKASYRLHPYNY